MKAGTASDLQNEMDICDHVEMIPLLDYHFLTICRYLSL